MNLAFTQDVGGEEMKQWRHREIGREDLGWGVSGTQLQNDGPDGRS